MHTHTTHTHTHTHTYAHTYTTLMLLLRHNKSRLGARVIETDHPRFLMASRARGSTHTKTHTRTVQTKAGRSFSAQAELSHRARVRKGGPRLRIQCARPACLGSRLRGPEGLIAAQPVHIADQERWWDFDESSGRLLLLVVVD